MSTYNNNELKVNDVSKASEDEVSNDNDSGIATFDYTPPKSMYVVIKPPVKQKGSAQYVTSSTQELSTFKISLDDYKWTDQGSDDDVSSDGVSMDTTKEYVRYKTHIRSRFKNDVCIQIFKNEVTKIAYLGNLSINVSDYLLFIVICIMIHIMIP